MLKISFLALVVAVISVPNESSAQIFSAVANVSCTPYQTPCTLGCCPYESGVCCADGFECCQNGQTCIPFIGICVGLVKDENGDMSLNSKKATSLENLVTACPPGTTTCGYDKCCRYPQATCCSDGIHCCPYRYRCDLPHNRCIQDTYNGVMSSLNTMLSVPALKTIKKSPYKSCPGDGRICPSYTSCCIGDDGKWNCCPNLSYARYGSGQGECCDTIFGHMCCPDDYPTCTIFGCTK